jgi:hypothetical protein
MSQEQEILEHRVQMAKLERAEAKQVAYHMWQDMTESEHTLVRFGMFPAHRMQDESVRHIDGHLLAVALMEIAEACGGMIA